MNNLKKKVADTAIIVLAAGNSSRLGQPKQAVEFEGRSLLKAIVSEAAISMIDHTVVVLGSAHHDNRQLLPNNLKVDIAINKAWEWGMGNTLRFGLQHVLLNRPNLKSVIISVCDQPFLDHVVLNNLQEKHVMSEDKIVACKYENDAFGVPVLFPEMYFNDLLECPDDAGAKSILSEHINEVVFVPFAKGEIDIDTPDDLVGLGAS